MPQLNWPQEPTRTVRAYEARRSGRGEIGALILWATWTVEGLHYLGDLNDHHHASSLPGPNHSPDIVNIAHVRWATASAITALDLCAAALGREFCPSLTARERDLRDFDVSSSNRKLPVWRSALSLRALAWVDTVVADQRYKEVHGARNPLTHSRFRRNLFLGGPTRTEFVVTATGNAFTAHELVCLACDLATEHVTVFLDVLNAL
jgi:hypothetical protein